MKYTAGQAAKATGLSTATITRALKSGKISGVKDEAGSWSIDPSELHRVFPMIAPASAAAKPSKGDETPDTSHEKPSESIALQVEVKLLREALDDAKSERDSWREMAERLALSAPIQPTEPQKETAPEPSREGFGSRLRYLFTGR